MLSTVFFLNAPSAPAIYTLSLHDALPISGQSADGRHHGALRDRGQPDRHRDQHRNRAGRSEEHTSELQSLTNLVCRLLLEKKNNKAQIAATPSQRGHYADTQISYLTLTLV